MACDCTTSLKRVTHHFPTMQAHCNIRIGHRLGPSKGHWPTLITSMEIKNASLSIHMPIVECMPTRPGWKGEGASYVHQTSMP